MMLKLLGNIIKVSPTVLGASLLVASSTHAAQVPATPSLPDQTANTSSSEATVAEKPTVEPSTEQPETTVFPSSTDAREPVPQQTVAIATSQAAPLLEPTVKPLLPQPTVEKISVSQLPSSDTSPSLNRADSTLAQQSAAPSNSTADSTQVLEQINRYSNEGNSNSLNQVTNVNQLSDISPGDWAYEALRSLVERYGCIAGYPDGTFRGNRAMTRYEFAAGLNACLQQVERLIASSTSDFVTKSDLAALQRLTDEFKTELTTLGARVGKLEGRVAFLENHQFSTTTKLNGEAIFAISDLFGGQAAPTRAFPNGPDYARTETVFQNRVRLNFDTSFTGKDRLRTRLQAGNMTEFGPLTSNPAGNPPGTNITREGRFGFQADSGNSVSVQKLYYRSPLTDFATIHLFANAGAYEDFVPSLNPSLEASGTGALSLFGRANPIYRVGSSATSAGAGLTLSPKSPFRVDLGYFAPRASDPSEKSGLFDGSYNALAQVTFQPTKAFSLAATYIHSYDSQSNTAGGGSLRHGMGSIASNISTNRPVVGNSYGIEASYAFTPQVILSGWAGYTRATVIGRGNADVWNYAATLALNDFGTKGSTLGFVVGMEPKLTGSDPAVGALLPGGRRRDPDTGLHIEGFYKYALTKNITITPGIIWLTAPGHNEDNDDIVIGVVRTTFTF